MAGRFSLFGDAASYLAKRAKQLNAIEPATEEALRAAREARYARIAGPSWERMTPEQRQLFMAYPDKRPTDGAELLRQERAYRLGFTGPWYHGAERTDRIVEADKFDPKRATSGPMAYFTRDPEMASNYAKNKSDTSLYDESGDVSSYFRVAPKDIGMSGRTPIPVERSWHFLPQETREEIARRAPRIGYANPDEATGPLILHPEGVEASLSPDHMRYIMQREHRGNALAALRDMWHDSGELVGNEAALEDIYRLAGYPAPISQSTAPWTTASGVVPAMLRMQNPLVTSNHEDILERVAPFLEQRFARDRTRLKPGGADMWAKETRFTPRDWAAQLREDARKGENSFVFTSIPDKVTAALRDLGHDSILDTGGKMGGSKHDVAIPFDPHQVRSTFADFDPAKLHETGLMKASGGRAGYASGGLKNLVKSIIGGEPSKTVSAYKLFRQKGDDLYPLFVNANQPVPVGQWLDAESGPLVGGKVKSSLGPLAYRPGWHAGDLPIATHIGGKSAPGLKAPDYRPDNQVWAQIDMPDDVDWQTEALARAQRNKAGVIIPRTAHITDQIPIGGHYRYKTNPNMTGEWLIGGSMKVNRILPDDEVRAVNEAAGVSDLPRLHELMRGRGYAHGGATPAINMLTAQLLRDGWDAPRLRFLKEVPRQGFAPGGPLSGAALRRAIAIARSGRPAGYFEVAPGETWNKPLQQAWETLRDADKRRITDRAISEHMVPWQKATGISGDVVGGLGGYKGFTNPSKIFYPDNPEHLAPALNEIGEMFAQDAMMGVARAPFAGSSPTGIVTVKFPENVEPDRIHDVYQRLMRRGLTEGHSTDVGSGVMSMLAGNGGRDTKRIARGIDRELGRAYPVWAERAHVSFPENRDDYGLYRNVAPGGSPGLRLGSGSSSQIIDTEARKAAARDSVRSLVEEALGAPLGAEKIGRAGGGRMSVAIDLAKRLGRMFPEGSGYRGVPGKPSSVEMPGFGRVETRPIPEIEQAAAAYNRSRGLPSHEIDRFAPINPEFSGKVAREFDRMAHDPSDPLVRRAYDALIDDTLSQYRAAKDTGIDFRFLKPGQADPYAASPALGYEDIINKGRLFVFPTDQGFGTLNASAADNPLLRRVGRIGDKSDAVANDAFRIVHDLYGHYGPGNPFFRAPGEERAFQLHSKMFSPEALPAATSETRGQNSWVNYGPPGEFNRKANAADTIYADQKIGLMPSWAGALPPEADADVEGYIRNLIRNGRARGGALIQDQHPTSYLPGVGRQVMADGGASPSMDRLMANVNSVFSRGSPAADPSSLIGVSSQPYRSGEAHTDAGGQKIAAPFITGMRGGYPVPPQARRSEPNPTLPAPRYGDIEGILSRLRGRAGFAGGGRGDIAKGVINFARRLNEGGFYSPAAEAVSALKQNKGRVEDFMNAIRGRPGVTKEELEGATSAFSPGQSVTRDELADHFHGRIPNIQESVYESAPITHKPVDISDELRETGDEPQWRRWQETHEIGPRGNYYYIDVADNGEHMLRHRHGRSLGEFSTMAGAVQEANNMIAGIKNPAKFFDYSLPGGDRYREVVLHSPPAGGESPVFRGSHFNEPNAVAHLRMSDRPGNALHVDEIQSDWGQRARDYGFLGPDAGSLSGQAAGPTHAVPRGPYIGSTEGWTDLALKRALMEAARGGRGRLVWTPGAEQAARYSLANDVRSISYDPTEKTLSFIRRDSPEWKGYEDVPGAIEPHELAGHIGKDAAQRLLATEPHRLSGNHFLEGEDLRVGGQGMLEYYDRIVPSRLQKVLKRIGHDAQIDMRSYELPQGAGSGPVMGHALNITPELRELIMKGLPAYRDGGRTDSVQRAMDIVRNADVDQQEMEPTQREVNVIRDLMQQSHMRGTSGVPHRLMHDVKPGKAYEAARLGLSMIPHPVAQGLNTAMSAVDLAGLARRGIREGHVHPADLISSLPSLGGMVAGLGAKYLEHDNRDEPASDVFDRMRQQQSAADVFKRMRGDYHGPTLASFEREGYDVGGGAKAKAAKAVLDNIISLAEARSRVASPFHEDPDIVEKARQYVNTLKVPQGNVMTPGSFYSIKQTRPVSDVTSTVEDIPGVSPLARRFMSWEDFVREAKGGTLINVAGDRSNLGRMTQINGRDLAWPVDLHAGPQYMLEPNRGAVWANNEGHATSFWNAIREASKRGPVYGAYHPMGVQSVDSSHNMIDALLSQIALGDAYKKDMRNADRILRAGAHAAPEDQELAAEALKKWPGFENAQEASEFARGLEGVRRSEIVKFLDKAPRLREGFPAVGETRVAITDRDLREAPGNMLGHRIVQFDPDNLNPESLAFTHSTYPMPTGGRYVGDVPFVQSQYVMPDVERQLMTKLAKGNRVVHPFSDDAIGRSSWRKSLETRKLAQPINDEMLDSVMLGLQRQKDYGFRKGGSVVDRALGVVSRRRRAA